MMKLIRIWWAAIKLVTIYPRKPGFSRIKSLLPKSVEALVGKYVVIEGNVVVSESLKSLGDGVFLGEGTRIINCRKIGDLSSISQDVKVGLRSHPKDHFSTSPLFYSKTRGLVSESSFSDFEGDTIIEEDVLISSNVLIMSGVTIGRGAIIGANSFVKDSIPPYSIAVGSPAKVVSYRFDEEMRMRMTALKWDSKLTERLFEIKALSNAEEVLKILESDQE